MIRLLLLASAAALAGGAWLCWSHLGWWSFLAVPVAGYLFFRLAGEWLLRQALLVPFRAKGKVLRGATATIHAVLPCEAPPPDEGPDGEDGESKDWPWYRVDVTIAPAAEVAGPFVHWEPGSLRLGPPDADPADDDGERVCEVASVEVEEEGAWAPDEGMKFAGPRRLRLRIRIRPGVERLSFLYCLERFGEFRVARQPALPRT